jgi:hypothetical protein
VCSVAHSSEAGIQIIDQDTTINAANSYPEPPDGADVLSVQIQNGTSSSPRVNLEPGGVIGGYVDLRGRSSLTMTGGQIQGQTTCHDESTLTIMEGSSLPLIHTYQNSDVTGILEVKDAATLNLYGGNIFGQIYQQGSSTINVFGYGLNVDGELPTSPDTISGVKITGYYPNGNPLSLDIVRLSANAKVVINTVPEPSVLALICMLIFFPRTVIGR